MTVWNGRLATIFGGSGFVGRYVVQALARRGWRIRNAVRRPDLAGHLQPYGVVGQIQSVQANLRHRDSVARAIVGADAVVNCVGILSERGAQTFEAVQAAGARTAAEAAAAAGIADFVHISAIGADPDSPSAYGRTKAQGEAAIFAGLPGAVVMRPSIVFGPEDDFFNRFAGMARLSPVLPLIGGGETKFQPVYSADIGEAVARALEGAAKPGVIYELGGPEVRTFRQCLELMLEVVHRRRAFASIPFAIAGPMARILKFLPGAPLTPDQVKLLERDNVVSEAARREGRTLEGLGIEPASLAAILPTYLVRFRPRGQFDRRRPAEPKSSGPATRE